VPGRGYRFVGSITRVDDVTDLQTSGSAAGRLSTSAGNALRMSMVVLPFVSLGESPQEDRLAAAITDDLTTELARLPAASVIARRTAEIYKDNSHDIRRVGEELRVRYVIEGSVRRLNDIVRVNAKLVSAETNTHLWAGRFDEAVADSHAQDAIVGRLRAALSQQILKVESARAMRERPDRPDAIDLLLRAWSTWGNTASLESLGEAGICTVRALFYWHGAASRKPCDVPFGLCAGHCPVPSGCKAQDSADSFRKRGSAGSRTRYGSLQAAIWQHPSSHSAPTRSALPVIISHIVWSRSVTRMSAGTAVARRHGV
jgi:TolB-like protein